MVAQLESLFPGLRRSPYQVTSPSDDVYNCIAWAGDDQSRWWWPDPLKNRYWSVGALREETLAGFQEAFASLGYLVCDAEQLEEGFDKVALFADADGFPTHAARQLDS